MQATTTPATTLFQNLSQSQYLSPHTRVNEALVKLFADRVSSVSEMNDRLVRAGIDHHLAIGRLKREELLRLSRELAEITFDTEALDPVGKR